MRTSVPQVLWIPDLETYDYKVFISYDSLFLRHKEAPPGIRGVRSWRSWTHPCVNKEGEYPIQLDLTLFWGGAPYTRIVEDRLIVRKDWGEGVQSLSVNLRECFDGYEFLRDPPKEEGNGFLRCIFRGQDEDC